MPSAPPFTGPGGFEVKLYEDACEQRRQQGLGSDNGSGSDNIFYAAVTDAYNKIQKVSDTVEYRMLLDMKAEVFLWRRGGEGEGGGPCLSKVRGAVVVRRSRR